MAKKKKTPTTEAPPPTVHSIGPPTEAPDPDIPPSQHHHHDHEHHHHHSHYARSVDSGGNVKETKTEIVEIKEVKEIPVDQIDQEEEEEAPSNASKKSKSVKAPTAPPSAKPPSSKPPTVKPPSTKAPTAKPPSTKAPTVKPPSVKEPPPPDSPAPSHKSARSSHSHHHQPPVIVNVTIPQAAPAPPPAPIIIPQPAPAEVVEQEEVVIDEPNTSTPLVVPTPIKTPTIIPPSPKPSSIKSVKSKAKSIAPAPTVVEEAEEPPLEEEVTEETKVVTTTTTTTTTKKRPPSPPKTPKVISTDNPFVEDIDEPPPPPKSTKAKSVAPPPSAAAAKSIKSKPKTLPPPSPVPTIHSIAATPLPLTPMKLPSLFKSSPGGSGGSGKKKPMKIIETTTVEKIIVPVDSDEEVEEVIVEEEVDTAATTVGNTTTKGIGGARSNALTATPGRRSGTKAGLRPIPMVDYQALIQSTPPPSIKKTLPSLPPSGTVAGPKTIVTYSAQLDRDSQGNEHIHARMRDHTGVVKGPSPSAIPGSIHSPPPPTMPALSIAPQPQGPKTIVTYSAQLDRDSQGNEHLHGRLRDHTGAAPAAPTMAAPTAYTQTTYVPAATTYIPAPTTVAPPPAPTLPTAIPGSVPEGPKTIVTLSAQLDRDSKGNEHLHARMRDHTGVTKGLELDTGEGLPLETEKERKKREKKEKKLAEKLAAKEAAKGLEGNPYKPIGGGVPPPKSERYAYPPAPTVIEQAAKERFQNRFNGGGGGGVQPPGMGMSMGMGMGGMGPPYPPIQPALYPRPPPLVATRPPMFGPPMMGMGMGMGMPMGGMGMAMGMPMMGMGMPMGMSMPMATPIPGVVPGQPGMGWYNSLPGRFGRDMLGRDFAGPGGVGSSQPYRPPDPSALPPMPFGLPFIARPGQEGFDQYGRMLPPDLPEGWDGWGRPLVSTNPAPNAPPGGPGGPLPPPAPAATQAAGVPPQPTATQTQQMPFSSSYGTSSMTGTGSRSMSSTLSSNGTGRPDQYVGWLNYYLISPKSHLDDPRGYEEIWEESIKKRIDKPPCFDRPPAKSDSYFRYDPFQPFSLPCSSLNYPHQLHLPPELVSHDVNEEDWSRFIDDLSKEALTNARHPLHLHARGGRGMGPEPVLSEAVHSLLASWAVAFFSPRGIKIYAASEESNERILPPPIEPPPLKRGYSHADEWSDEEYSSNDEYNFDDLSEDEEERYQRKKDMYLPRIERQWRKDERLIKRRREKRRRLREGELRLSRVVGNWEIHFICSTPTIWQQGARPRGYGEPVIRLRR